jgi:hypothetical protein
MLAIDVTVAALTLYSLPAVLRVIAVRRALREIAVRQGTKYAGVPIFYPVVAVTHIGEGVYKRFLHR